MVSVNMEMEMEIERASFSAEKLELYKRYQMTVHKDPEHKCSEEAFSNFLVCSPLCNEDMPVRPAAPGSQPPSGFGTMHQLYRLNHVRQPNLTSPLPPCPCLTCCCCRSWWRWACWMCCRAACRRCTSSTTRTTSTCPWGSFPRLKRLSSAGDLT